LLLCCRGYVLVAAIFAAVLWTKRVINALCDVNCRAKQTKQAEKNLSVHRVVFGAVCFYFLLRSCLLLGCRGYVLAAFVVAAAF
jgi:uncharacterized membrane protein YiaA